MEVGYEIVVGIVGNVAAYLIGRLWDWLPKSLRQIRSRRFWGPAALADSVLVAYGPLIDPRDLEGGQDDDPFRWVKVYPDGRKHRLIGPRTGVIAPSETEAVSYLIEAVGALGRPGPAAPVVEDFEALKNLHRTIVSLGGISSNSMTDYAMRLPGNRLCMFEPADGTVVIRDSVSGQVFRNVSEGVPKDHGVTMRIVDEQHPAARYFVCTGLSEGGTLGAAWYLSQHWELLGSVFGRSFAVVVEASPGVAGATRPVHVMYETSVGQMKSEPWSGSRRLLGSGVGTT